MSDSEDTVAGSRTDSSMRKESGLRQEGLSCVVEAAQPSSILIMLEVGRVNE